MSARLVGLGFALVLMIAGVASAQETGTVSGFVLDSMGHTVSGATVRISGDQMPAARSTVTSETGQYNFPQILPGTYKVVAEKTGVGKLTQTVEVEVARDTQRDFVLGTQVAEIVSVTAPAVDVKSTEVNFNYRRSVIQDLPLDRSYLGLLQLVPGIADNGAFAPNGGGSRQDNTYLMDGVNITNPLFGYLSTEVNELDISQLNVKKGAISAEFGRSTGFVSNAVSRSGTNTLTGSYRFEAIPNEWIKESTKTTRSPTDRWVNSFSVSGPLRKNLLFFYGSGRIFQSNTTRASNISGALPDRHERTNEVFGKATAQHGRQAINVGYRHRPTKVDYADIGSTDAATVGSNTVGTNRVANVNYDLFIDHRTTASVKYIRADEQSESVAITDLGFQPTFDPTRLPSMGRVVINGIGVGGNSLRLNRQNYARDEVKATLTRFLDLGGSSHQVRAGFGFDRGFEDLTRQSNGWGSISTVIQNGATLYDANYYPDQPTQFSIGRTYSIFVQDEVTLGSHIVINAGLLFNRDEFAQDISNLTSSSSTVVTGTFLKFGFGDEIQPRIGLNYQLRKGKGDKAYANWGRYYGLDQKSSARALASGRLYLEDSFFALDGTFVSKATAANTAAKNIAPGLNPPYTDESIVGYATPFMRDWTLDAFFLYRNSTSFIEDIPTVLPFTTFQYQNDPAAFRKFKTFTIDVTRRLKNRWSADISYAWSRLYGTYDQDYSGGLAGAAVFNTSSLLDDGPGAFTADTNRNGVMSQDRTHVYKVLVTWMPKWIDNFSVGGYVRGQSGTPWEARGLPWGSSATYLNYLEPAGSHRNPFWTNMDLLLKYGVKVDKKRTVRLEARILNVFNTETVRLVDQRQYLNGRTRPSTLTPTPADCLSCWTASYTAIQYAPSQFNLSLVPQPNPTFGLPTTWTPPRRLLMSLLFDF